MLTVYTITILGASYAVVFFLLQTFGILANFKPEVYIFSLLSSGSFLLGLILIRYSPSKLSKRIYQYGSLWIGAFVIICVLGLVFLWTSFLFDVSYTGGKSLGFFLFLVFVFNVYGLYSSFTTKVTKYRISFKKPHSWHKKRIVLISDTHYGNIYEQRHARRLVSQINSLKPQVVLIA